MAVQSNGQPVGPISFTDDFAGKRVFIGENTPSNPTNGDIWVDSDIFNNAGKNLIASVPLAGVSFRDLSVSPIYKDVYVVFRGMNPSATADVVITLNGQTTGYLESGVATNSLITVPNMKAGNSTSHFALEIVDTQDSASFSWAYFKGVYTNASDEPILLSKTSAFLQAAALSTIRVELSTGTFSGGTILVYGVN